MWGFSAFRFPLEIAALTRFPQAMFSLIPSEESIPFGHYPVRTDAAGRSSLFMPRNLKRDYGRGDLHFITFSCYRRRESLGTAKARNVFSEIPVNRLRNVQVEEWVCTTRPFWKLTHTARSGCATAADYWRRRTALERSSVAIWRKNCFRSSRPLVETITFLIS